MAIQDLQEHFLFTTSAEYFTNPTNRDKLLKLSKEKGIQDIMDNNNKNISTHRTSVSYIYKKNLPELGENGEKDNYCCAPAILQAVLEVTYIDDGEVGADSDVEFFALQHEIEEILSKGWFQIKSWKAPVRMVPVSTQG